jgi:hypothetical protein
MDWLVLAAYIVVSYLVVAVATRLAFKSQPEDKDNDTQPDA